MYRYGVDRYGAMVPPATMTPTSSPFEAERAEPREQATPTADGDEPTAETKLAPLGPREFTLTLETADDAAPAGGLRLVVAADSDPAGDAGPQVLIASVALSAASATAVDKAEEHETSDARDEEEHASLTTPADTAAARAAAEGARGRRRARARRVCASHAEPFGPRARARTGSTILAINDVLLGDAFDHELPPDDLAAAVAQLIDEVRARQGRPIRERAARARDASARSPARRLAAGPSPARAQVTTSAAADSPSRPSRRQRRARESATRRGGAEPRARHAARRAREHGRPSND